MLSVLKRPFFWIGVATSVGALALAVRGLEIDEVLDALAGANFAWLIPAAAILLVGLYFRALRWGALFYPTRGLSTGKLFGAMNIGYMLNNLLPLRVGEFGRAFVIGETESIGKVTALTTVVVERIVDVIFVFALLLILLPFVDEPGWATGPALVLGIATISLAIALAAAGRARLAVLRLADWALRFAPSALRSRLRTAIESALNGFAVLGDPRTLARVLGLSVIAWGCSSLYTYCVLLMFDLPLTYAAPVLIMVALAMGMVIPSSAGYIGVHHAIAIEVLTTVFGVARADAAGFAFVSHALFFLIPTLLGIAYLWTQRGLWERLLSSISYRGDVPRVEPDAPQDAVKADGGR